MTGKEFITLTGKSGTLYRFNAYPVNYECPQEGGIYVYTKRTPQIGLAGSHVLVYIGITNSFNRRNYEHDNHDCITKENPNCICLMQEDNEQKRIAIEKDILLVNNTHCNIHHNS